MDDYYERLNQAFANWNGGEPSLEQRVEDLEAEIIQKQDILTFDTEPVEDSENPVTSGGLFSQFERYATKAALGVVAAQGAKNLLLITATSQTKNGVTFTINSDGSISLSGTATSTTNFALNGTLTLPSNRYTLSGVVPRNVYLTARSTSSVNYTVTYTTTSVSINDDIYYVYINISAGTTLDGVVIQPMIRRAEITDDTFVPYAPTNRELYEMILALQSGS